MCVNCQTLLDKEENMTTGELHAPTQASKEKAFLKYIPNVKRINVMSLIAQSISICLILCMIFLPIYKREYEPDDIESLEQLIEISENGYLEKSFSLFDELKILISQLTSSEKSESNTAKISIITIFPIFEALFAIIFLCMTVFSAIKTLSLLQSGENSTMLMYNEMLKTGGTKKKEKFFKNRFVVSVLFYAIFDIVFTKIFSSILVGSSDFRTIDIRNMVHFTGMSGSFAIIIILLICYIISNAIHKKESEKMLLDITKSEFDNT